MPVLYPPYVPVASPAPSTPNVVAPIEFDTSWYFDMNAGEFVVNPDGTTQVTPNTEKTLEEWIKTTLVTDRFRYPIYPRWYGSEVMAILGQAAALPVVAATVEGYIKSALLVDDRVVDVSQFKHVIANDEITTSFTVLAYNGSLLNFNLPIGAF